MTTHYSPETQARDLARKRANRQRKLKAGMVALRAWKRWARNMQRWCKGRGEGWEA